MTATLPPLGPTADTWAHPEVVDLIAAGSDWPDHLLEVWRKTVAAPAHQLSHPVAIAGCPGCSQTGTCVWCTRPLTDCPAPVDHDRRARGSDESLLLTGLRCTGVAVDGHGL